MAVPAAPLPPFFVPPLFPLRLDFRGFTVPVVVVVNLVAAGRAAPEPNAARREHVRDRLWCLNETTRGYEAFRQEAVREVRARVGEAGHEERERLRRTVLAEARARLEDLRMAR